jgi:hypothetical protein
MMDILHRDMEYKDRRHMYNKEDHLHHMGNLDLSGNMADDMKINNDQTLNSPFFVVDSEFD